VFFLTLLLYSFIRRLRVTSFITQDFLLFAHETPTFSSWAVLGEGCSSARDSFGIRALLYARGSIDFFFCIILQPDSWFLRLWKAPFSVDDREAVCDFPPCKGIP
jgi:hypothetical protein